MKRSTCLALVALLFVAPGAADAQERLVEHDVVDVKAPSGMKVRRVLIDNRLGSVTVEGHDRQSITVRAIKRATNRETLNRLVVSLVPGEQGTASIQTELRAGNEYRPVPSGSIGVDLVIQVPRQARIVAEVWNGAIHVSQVDEGAELIANDGEITVKQVSGPVSAESLRGRQRFAEVFGDLVTQAVEGDVDLDVIRGHVLRASAVHGDIAARRLRVKDLSINAIHGDVTIEASVDRGGRYQISSRKGKIQLRIQKGPLVMLTARSKKPARLSKEWSAQRDANGRWVSSSGDGAQPAHLILRSENIEVSRF